MASTLGMSLLWIEFHNHTGQDPLRLKFVFEDIFLIPNVLIFVSIWFIYIKVKIRNIRKEQEQKRILDENLFFERKEKKIAEEKIWKISLVHTSQFMEERFQLLVIQVN